MSEATDRKKALERLAKLPQNVREDIALVVETADAQGDWHWNGEDSVYQDDVQATLSTIAYTFRHLGE